MLTFIFGKKNTSNQQPLLAQASSTQRYDGSINKDPKGGGGYQSSPQKLKDESSVDTNQRSRPQKRGS